MPHGHGAPRPKRTVLAWLQCPPWFVFHLNVRAGMHRRTCAGACVAEKGKWCPLVERFAFFCLDEATEPRRASHCWSQAQLQMAMFGETGTRAVHFGSGAILHNARLGRWFFQAALSSWHPVSRGLTPAPATHCFWLRQRSLWTRQTAHSGKGLRAKKPGQSGLSCNRQVDVLYYRSGL